MRPPQRRILLGMLGMSIAFALLGPLSPAAATYPGSNGDIVYVRGSDTGGSEIRAMASDGSGDHTYAVLTGGFADVSFSSGATKAAVIDYTKLGARIVLFDLVSDTKTVVLRARRAPTQVLSSIALSPHGSRIAFADGSYPVHLYTIRADGSHLTKIATGYGDVDWCSNGRLVTSNGVFAGDGERFISTMDPDGGNKTVIATFPAVKRSWGSVYELIPSWSPDCGSVVFTAQHHRIIPDIWTVNADGSNFHRLTRTRGAAESGPLFSPDGTSIVFARQKNGSDTSDLWTMDPDGGNKMQITDTPDESEYALAWLPA